MKIAYQGIAGSYSESCAKENYPDSETIPCSTFQEAFELAKNDSNIKAIITEQNQLIGSINIETLILKYRLNIFAEHFYRINHNLLIFPGSKLKDVKEVHSHTAALSQTNGFIRKNNFKEIVMADTAGSAAYVAKKKDKSKAAIASKLSAEIYGLDILKSDVQDDKENFTRFLVFQKDISQPNFEKKGKYITSFLFKLKSKPAALYQSLGGFAINGVNLTKLQSYPEQNSFETYFFLCDLDGHIEDPKVQKSLEELDLHCQDFHVLGVFEADEFRNK